MENEIKTMRNRNVIAPNFTDLYSSRYYRLNKRMLGVLGQWPYQSVLESKIRVCFPLFMSCTILVPQIRSLVFTCRGLDRFAECFSPLATIIGCVVKLLNFMFKKPLVSKTKIVLSTLMVTVLSTPMGIQSYTLKIKKVLDEMLEDWKRVEDPVHVNIVMKYADLGRLYTILWVSGLYFGITLWVSLSMAPQILDVIDPLNYTREVFDFIPVDYGIDPEKYYYPKQIHCCSVIMVVLLVMPAIDTLYMCLALHVCAMFDLLRINLDNVIRENQTVSVMLKPVLNEDIHYHQVVACIKKHKVLLHFIKDIASSNESCLLFIVGLNMIGLSITAYQAVRKGNESETTIRYTIYSVTLVAHLFGITLPGHWIMSSSSAVQNYAYGTRWYMMSLRTRKLILLIIRAGIKPCTITAGKIYVMSLQNFSSVLQTSVSYLTVLISMQ